MKCIQLPDGHLLLQTSHLSDFGMNLNLKPLSELPSDEKISTIFSDWFTAQQWEELSEEYLMRDTTSDEDRVIELFRVNFIESLKFMEECARIDDEFNVAFSSIGRS